ncbi:protein FAM149B1 isoform X2 [Amia ocellicauda]|uniref:protein FAM149B1 isoform X2 n=1 Tax=Amia ocellicauda TaxID=2972642 RepID=UPI003463BA64
MISRYSRRPVSHNLEIRGLSRSSLEHHPLPEEEDDDEEDDLAHRYLHNLRKAEHPCYSGSGGSDTSGGSSCATVTAGDTARSWSGIHSYTGTGLSTERSSVFSWGYDEFDKAASRQVQQMFEEIDVELYEGGPGGQPRGLQDECQHWKSRFPHLRILGTQLLCPMDEGFQWFSREEPGSCPPTAPSQSQARGGAELSVQGRKAVLSRPCADTGSPPGLRCEDEPLVIEAEGLVEEYLAFDCRDMEEEWEKGRAGARRRPGLPPVSPYRCRRQAVLDLLFDEVWRELVGCMEELVRRHWEGCVSDEEKNTVTAAPARPDSDSPFLPAVQPRFSQPRPAPSLQPQSNRVLGGPGGGHYNLNGLIVIHGIPLQQRTLGALDKMQDHEERPSLRPGSSAVPSSKPCPRRPLEQSSSSLLRPPQSARRRNPPPRNLHPLGPGLSQSGTPGSMDEVIRGTRLPTASDRLASPPMPLSRNHLLPPISTGDPETPRPAQRPRGSSSRAHSAVAEDGGGQPPRERLHTLDMFSRPNTTHTFRSDTPYRRSFTMLDATGPGRAGRASTGTDSLGIGVMGISLGISSSSFMDSFQHHALGHSPIEDEEEPESPAPPPALLVPAPVPARSHPRGGLTSRSSRTGL